MMLRALSMARRTRALQTSAILPRRFFTFSNKTRNKQPDLGLPPKDEDKWDGLIRLGLGLVALAGGAYFISNQYGSYNEKKTDEVSQCPRTVTRCAACVRCDACVRCVLSIMVKPAVIVMCNRCPPPRRGIQPTLYQATTPHALNWPVRNISPLSNQ